MFAHQNLSSRPSLRLLHVFFFLVGFSVLPLSGQADDLEDAARSLARKVAAAPRVLQQLRLEWRNQSSLPEVQFASLRNAFERELRSQGVVLENSGDTPGTVAVTLAETATDIRLVAWVTVAEVPSVRIVSIPRGGMVMSSMREGNLTVEKRLLLEQPWPILDAVLVEGSEPSGEELLVLSEESFAVYRPQSETWVRRAFVSIPQPGSLSRDLFGEIEVTENNVQARVHSLACRGDLRRIEALECRVVPQGAGTRADAGLPSDPPREILAAIEEKRAVVLKAPCRADGLLLQTDSGDWTAADRLQAFKVGSKEANLVGTATDVPGPVIRLGSSGVEKPASAIAVVRNLSTGNYEAYRVTLACGN